MAKETTLKISQEIATKEVIEFVQKWKKRPQKEDQITEDYPDIIDAVKDGFLVFDEKKLPTLKLRTPVLTSEGNLHLESIKFKTRIKPTVKADLSDGLNVQKQQAKYVLRLISYIIDEPVAMLDKIEQEDYSTIEQICVVFI